MSDEKKESRINVEDLPQGEQELTTEDVKKVRGGITTASDISEAKADAAQQRATEKF